MYDGRITPAADIAVGDELMGPESQPRRVLSTTVVRGGMFRITPNKGAAWECNDVHVVTLMCTNTGPLATGSNGGRNLPGAVRDVPLDEYIQWPSGRKHIYRKFRVGVDFPEGKRPPAPPYMLDALLGDGCKKQPHRHIYG